MTSALNDLVVKKVITDDEFVTIIDHLAKASTLDEMSINQAVAGVANAGYVAAALKKDLLQQNILPAPAPKPVVPQMQPALPANEEMLNNFVSAPYPTVTDKMADDALKQVLLNLIKKD